MREPFAALLVVMGLGGCVTGPEQTTLPFVVEDGKEDDFLSVAGQEYVLRGSPRVTLETEYATATAEQVEARVRELIGLENIAVGWFLNQYLMEKSHDEPNQGYGGYGAMVRDGSYKAANARAVEGEPLVWQYDVELLIGGKRDLMSRMPLTTQPDGRRGFELTMGQPSNDELARLETNHEWYRSSPWDGFNPANLPADRLQKVFLTVDVETASLDAWPDYRALVSDGILDVDLFFGWDYHSAYHVTHAREVFDWLVSRGFAMPEGVSGFDQLAADSGPLTRTMKAGGADVRVDVRIVYGKTGSPTDPDTDAGGRLLESLARDAFENRDVIAYSGHSGPFYGFALANWRRTDEGDLDDSEFASLEIPAGRYQVVLAEGCDTYHLGEALRSNPAKPDGAFMDLVTTTAPSNAASTQTVRAFFDVLFAMDAQGNHQPRRYSTMLRALSSNAMYGVHGIDDNPHLHPWADPTRTGQACAAAAECGPGGACVDRAGQAVCAPECTADDACGEGFECRATAGANGYLQENRCVAAPRPPGDYTRVEQAIESQHPYADGTDQSWTIDPPTGATALRVHFSRIETESGYDRVTLSTAAGQLLARYEGTHGELSTNELPRGPRSRCGSPATRRSQAGASRSTTSSGVSVPTPRPGVRGR